MSKRIRFVQSLFFLWMILIIGRLAYWQVVKAGDLQSQAEMQYSTTVILPAFRGNIVSSDGFPLVTNTESYLLYAQPRQVVSDNKQLNKLMELLPASTSASQVLSRINSPNLSWVALADGISREAKDKIQQLKIDGLGFESEPVRYYPEGSDSAYLTGFVGKDTNGNLQGYFGLEGFYDRLLSGKPGRLIGQQDAFAHPILISDEDRIPPQNGGTLVTSIDRTLQYLVSQKLAEGIKKYDTDGGTVTVMDTSTGNILAMAALPGYDPTNYTDYSTSLYKNPIVSDFYEPGSTFKVVVMASALDAGTVTPDTRCTICTGPAILSGLSVHNYDDQYHPNSTMTDIILHSDNIGMVNVAKMMGREKLLAYIRKFGFGKLTGIDLQEEASPALRPDDQWQEVDWGTAAFGQGIAVTRIQLVTAVNAVANHGELIEPRILKQIINQGVVQNLPTPPSTRVISIQAASQMTLMMINGVEKGEVRYYKPQGFLIAGKTGTAQVPIQGHYDTDSAIASFVGFAPADNPKFTMLVTLKNPKKGQWGSTTAAPLWFSIADEIFRYYKIPPKTG